MNKTLYLDLDCPSFRHNIISAQYLENKLMNLTKLCICIDTDKI